MRSVVFLRLVAGFWLICSFLFPVAAFSQDGADGSSHAPSDDRLKREQIDRDSETMDIIQELLAIYNDYDQDDIDDGVKLDWGNALLYFFHDLKTIEQKKRTPFSFKRSASLQTELIAFAKNILGFEPYYIEQMRKDIYPLPYLDPHALRLRTSYFRGHQPAPSLKDFHVWVEFSGFEPRDARLYDLDEILVVPERNGFGDITIYSGSTHAAIAIIRQEDLKKIDEWKLSKIVNFTKDVVFFSDAEIQSDEKVLEKIETQLKIHRGLSSIYESERKDFIQTLPDWFQSLDRIINAGKHSDFIQRARRMRDELISFAKDVLFLTEPHIKRLQKEDNAEQRQDEPPLASAEMQRILISERILENIGDTIKVEAKGLDVQILLISLLPGWFFQIDEIIQAKRSASLVKQAETVKSELIDFVKKKLQLDDKDILILQRESRSLLTNPHNEEKFHSREDTDFFNTKPTHPKGSAPETKKNFVWLQFSHARWNKRAFLYSKNEPLVLPHGKPTGNITIYSGVNHQPVVFIPGDELPQFLGLTIGEIIKHIKFKSLGLSLEQATGEVGIWIQTEKNGNIKLFFPWDVQMADLFGQGEIKIFRKVLNRMFSAADRAAGKDFQLLAYIPAEEIRRSSRKTWTPEELLKYATIVLPEFANHARCESMLRTISDYKKNVDKRNSAK
jgi:hypothetical protein